MAPHKLTVAQWLRDWLEGRVGLAETTIEGYRRDAARVADRIGQLRLGNVSTATLNSLYRELGETLAPATVKNTHAVVHKALKDAVRQGILARNPAEHVELPGPEPPEANTWTAEELARFLDHVVAARLGSAWRGAWYA